MMWLLPFFYYFLFRICVDGQEAVTVKHTDYFLNQPVNGDFSIIDEYHKQVAHLPNEFMDVHPHQNLLTFPSQVLLDLQPPTQGLLNVPMHNLLNMQTPLHTYAYFSEPGPPSLNSYPGLAYYLGQYGQEKESAPSPHLEAKLRSYQSMKPLPVAGDEDVKPIIPPVQHPRRRIYQTQEKVNTITLPQSSYQVRTPPTNMKLEGSYGEPIRPIVSVGGRPTIHDPDDSIQIQTGVARVMIGRKPTTTTSPIDRMNPKTDEKDPFGMTDEEYQEFIPTIAVEPFSEENEELENLAEGEVSTKLPSLLEILSTASVFAEGPINSSDKESQAEVTAEMSVPTVSGTSTTVSSALVSSTTMTTTSHPNLTRSPGLEKIENIREILTVTDEYELIDKNQSEVNRRRTTVTENKKPTASVIEITSQSTAVISTVTSTTAVAASTMVPFTTTTAKKVTPTGKPTQKKIRRVSTVLPTTFTATSTSSSTTFAAKKTTPKTTSRTIVTKKTTGNTTRQLSETTTTTLLDKSFASEGKKSSFTSSNENLEKEMDDGKTKIPMRTTVTEKRETTAGMKTTPRFNAETMQKSKTTQPPREIAEVATAPTRTINGFELMMDITVSADRLSTPTTITTKIFELTTVPPKISSSKSQIVTSTAKADTSPTYKSYKMERLSIWEILEHKKNGQTELSQDDTEEDVLQRLDDLNMTDEATLIDHKLKRFQTMAPNVLLGL